MRFQNYSSVEQEADVTILAHRPEYYDIKIMPDGSSSENKMELIIAKGRDIGTGSIIGRTQQIFSLEGQCSQGIPITTQPF